MSGPFTIPNLLTAIRIAFIPAIVVLFYLPYHWSDMACGVVISRWSASPMPSTATWRASSARSRASALSSIRSRTS